MSEGVFPLGKVAESDQLLVWSPNQEINYILQS